MIKKMNWNEDVLLEEGSGGDGGDVACNVPSLADQINVRRGQLVTSTGDFIGSGSNDARFAIGTGGDGHRGRRSLSFTNSNEQLEIRRS